MIAEILGSLTKAVLLVPLLVAFFPPCAAQWSYQYVPTTRDLLDVRFADSAHGWIVGGIIDSTGVVLGTSDGGSSWKMQAGADTIRALLGVLPMSQNVCWAVGADTTVLKTTDGGTTWIRQHLNLALDGPWWATRVAFADSLRGWMSGFYPFRTTDSSFILRTTDGGKIWTKAYLHCNCDGAYLNMVDSIHLFLLCYQSIARTTDGFTWQKIPLSTDVSDLQMVTPQVGWLGACNTECTCPGVLRTIDSVVTWNFQKIFCAALPAIYISFVDTSRGWMVEPYPYVQIWNTTDGGANWTKQDERPAETRVDDGIYFLDSLHGWMVGTEGMVLHTSNGGVSTGVEKGGTAIPRQFGLFQNHPNPFNPSTSIRYEMPGKRFVTVKVYDLLGREITTLVNETKPPGIYEVNWNASNVVSGVYFYIMRAGHQSITRKMLVIR